jgi:hypothetical protein
MGEEYVEGSIPEFVSSLMTREPGGPAMIFGPVRLAKRCTREKDSLKVFNVYRLGERSAVAFDYVSYLIEG